MAKQKSNKGKMPTPRELARIGVGDQGQDLFLTPADEPVERRMPTPAELSRIGVGAPGEDLFLSDVPKPQPAPSGKMPGQPEFNDETPSDEEQAQYDQFINRALDFMADSAEKLVASMNEPGRPVHENVGELAVKIGKMIMGTAQAAGVQIGNEVIHAAGQELVEHLMELGDNSGIFDFDEASDQYDQVQAMALLHAQKVVGEALINSPKYDGAMQEQAQNFYAQQVAGEVQRGEAPENFHENLGNQVAGGVSKAIRGG